MISQTLLTIYRLFLILLTPCVFVFVVHLDYSKFMQGNEWWVWASFCCIPVLWLLWRLARPDYKTAATALYWTAFVLFMMPSFVSAIEAVLANLFLLFLVSGIVLTCADAIRNHKKYKQMVQRVQERYLHPFQVSERH